MDMLQQLNSGTSGLKYFIRSYKDDYSIKGELSRERYTRMLELLIRSFGDEETVTGYLSYKIDSQLENYAEDVTYAKDTVYGDIKELEFIRDFLMKSTEQTTEYGAILNGVTNALELYSYLFNNWEIYEDKANQGLTPNPTEPEVEEFAYEDLVGTGVTPNYSDEDAGADENIDEFDEPKSRVERRRKRRTGRK